MTSRDQRHKRGTRIEAFGLQGLKTHHSGSLTSLPSRLQLIKQSHPKAVAQNRIVKVRDKGRAPGQQGKGPRLNEPRQKRRLFSRVLTRKPSSLPMESVTSAQEEQASFLPRVTSRSLTPHVLTDHQPKIQPMDIWFKYQKVYTMRLGIPLIAAASKDDVAPEATKCLIEELAQDDDKSHNYQHQTMTTNLLRCSPGLVNRQS